MAGEGWSCRPLYPHHSGGVAGGWSRGRVSGLVRRAGTAARFSRMRLTTTEGGGCLTFPATAAQVPGGFSHWDAHRTGPAITRIPFS